MIRSVHRSESSICVHRGIWVQAKQWHKEAIRSRIDRSSSPKKSHSFVSTNTTKWSLLSSSNARYEHGQQTLAHPALKAGRIFIELKKEILTGNKTDTENGMGRQPSVASVWQMARYLSAMLTTIGRTQYYPASVTRYWMTALAAAREVSGSSLSRPQVREASIWLYRLEAHMFYRHMVK